MSIEGRLERLLGRPLSLGKKIKPVEGEGGDLVKIPFEVDGRIRTLRKTTGWEPKKDEVTEDPPNNS